MLKIAVCDDQIMTVDYISAFIRGNFDDQNKIFEFTEPDKMERYVSTTLKGDLDILIIDVDLVLDNGLRVAERLKANFPNIRVIFISGKIQYAKDIFEIKPIYFIEKPIDDTKLHSAINLAIQDIEGDARDTISITSKGVFIILDLTRLLYIESNKRTVTLYEGKNKRESYVKLDIIEKNLPEKFCRCHRSYIVNFDYVSKMEMTGFTLFSGAKVPISQPKFKEVKHLFMKYLGDSL